MAWPQRRREHFLQGAALLEANRCIYCHIYQNVHENGCLGARNHILREVGGGPRRLFSSLFLRCCAKSNFRPRGKKRSWTKHKPTNIQQTDAVQFYRFCRRLCLQKKRFSGLITDLPLLWVSQPAPFSIHQAAQAK